MPSTSENSRWTKCISTHGNLRGVVVQASDVVQEMVNAHSLKDEQAKGLGEAVVGALLLASYCKPGERVNLNIQGSGQYKQALVDAYPDGSVRGYVIERPSGEIDPSAPDQTQMGPWGGGLMSVLRTKLTQEGGEGQQPYIGTVPLLTGHLAKDLTFYWVQSEQIPSAIGIAVKTKGEKIVVAGGFLIQAMPGASPAEVKAIEQHIHELSSLSESLDRHADPVQLLSKIFQNTAFMIVEERELRFECGCSMTRVERALTLVGVQELSSMLEEDGEAIVRCDFCSKEYRVKSEDLKRLISGQ